MKKGQMAVISKILVSGGWKVKKDKYHTKSIFARISWDNYLVKCTLLYLKSHTK